MDGLDKLYTGTAQINTFVCPHSDPLLDPEPTLVEMINLAMHEILFAIYSFTLPDVAAALFAAQKRGVVVEGVADATEWSRSTNSQPPLLVSQGLDIKKLGSTYNLMHMKLIVIDSAHIGLGSYNWTTNAEKQNEEVFITIGSTKTALVLRDAILRARAKGV